MPCHEANQNTSTNPKLFYFYGYAPEFNSNVDVIIKNLFCEHAFWSPVRKNNPTSAYSVIIFMNPTEGRLGSWLGLV